MKKKEKKDAASGRKVVNLEQLINKNAEQIMLEGNDFGNVLIKTLSHVLTNYKGLAVAAVGLAKAVAVLEGMAELHDLDLESLFNYTLKTFKEQYQEENK